MYFTGLSLHIAMDFYGMNLEEWISSHGKQSTEKMLAVLNGIVEGLNHIHEQGYIHHDLMQAQ